ncbi:Hypothetical protein KLENKIAIHU_816, partial [Klenkia terrae]
VPGPPRRGSRDVDHRGGGVVLPGAGARGRRRRRPVGRARPRAAPHRRGAGSGSAAGPRAGVRRPDQVGAGGHQPADQRGEVHPGGWSRGGHHRRRRRLGAADRRGRRPRNLGRRAAPRLRPVLPRQGFGRQRWCRRGRQRLLGGRPGRVARTRRRGRCRHGAARIEGSGHEGAAARTALLGRGPACRLGVHRGGGRRRVGRAGSRQRTCGPRRVGALAAAGRSVGRRPGRRGRPGRLCRGASPRFSCCRSSWWRSSTRTSRRSRSSRWWPSSGTLRSVRGGTAAGPLGARIRASRRLLANRGDRAPRVRDHPRAGRGVVPDAGARPRADRGRVEPART